MSTDDALLCLPWILLGVVVAAAAALVVFVVVALGGLGGGAIGAVGAIRESIPQYHELLLRVGN